MYVAWDILGKKKGGRVQQGQDKKEATEEHKNPDVNRGGKRRSKVYLRKASSSSKTRQRAETGD